MTPEMVTKARANAEPGGYANVEVRLGEIPEDVRSNHALHSACVSGASPVHEIERMLQRAGFGQIRVAPQDESKDFMPDWAPGVPITGFVVSATIEAVKPSA